MDRDGKRYVQFVLGDRSEETGKKLWEEVRDCSMGKVMTDYWKPYENFVPPAQHIQSKAETFTVEGYNSLLRHFLARLRRKTKCYSKSLKMLFYSLKLLMTWLN